MQERGPRKIVNSSNSVLFSFLKIMHEMKVQKNNDKLDGKFYLLDRGSLIHNAGCLFGKFKFFAIYK